MKRLLTKRQTVAILAITISTVLFASSAKAELPDWPGIFDPNLLPTLNIQMDPCDWDTILNNIPDANGCIETEIELPALFWADGEEASQILVAVRRKKSFAFPDEINPEKVALKIDINQYVTGQEWHGLNKLSLEANLDSVDLITEGLSVNLVRMGSMTEGFDYPTWYGNWVKVYVNGAYKGVYFNNEQRDKQYMQNHNFYSYHTSWLYKYADCEPGFVRKVGDDANPASPAVKALCYQPFVHPGGGDPNLQPPGGECSVPDDNTIIADMNQWVNVRRMLNNAAINSFMANSDDLFNHNNNTYFMDFNDANGTKRVYLAWDTDATFKDTEWDMYYTSTAQTYNSVILDIPVFRSQYNQIIRELLDGPFTEANIHAFLDNINTPELQAAIAADPYNQVGGNVPAKVAELKTWISDRIKNVRNQVDWDEPILPPGIVLLNDAFDGTVWDANWEGGHSWVEDNSVYAHAAPSAKAPAQSGGDFTCNPVDTNDATAIHIDFWFQKDDTEDTDDFLLYYYDGTSYNQIADLDTLGADDEWLHYTDTITNSNYFIPDFRIRFSGTPDRNEEVWVDEVVITKEIQQYTITATADANGTVDPNGAIIKNAGEDQLFTTTPNGSYTVDTWYVDGNNVQVGGTTYTLTNIQANHTVYVTFEQLQYTLTVNTVGSGSVTKSPDQATYTYGSIVDVNAIADAGWTFSAWSGDLGGSTNPETITMDGNKTVTATFTQDQYTLTINTVGSGSVTKSPDQATYTYGSIVDVNAIADAGWTFSAWSGDLGGSTNPETITMDGNKTVTATFTQDQYTLTINTVGSGSVAKVPDQATYTYGAVVTLTANPNVGWSFANWSGDMAGSTNPDTITMDGNRTITATFTEDQYTLTINTVGSGSVTRSPDQATYTYGSIVDVNAIADAGWTFSEWSGDLTGSTNPDSITMDGNKTVTATFTEDQYTLTINTVGSGSVTRSPDQATYTYGSIVDVNAIADAGWTFSEWSGDLTGSTNPDSITMDGNKTVTATFTEDQYTLTINTVGSGSVTRSPDQATYTYGSIVDVNAIADAGWTFSEWSGDLGGSTNPETITMDGNKTVTATFTEDQYTLTINTVGSGSVTKSPDQATYTYGSIVDVNAIADAGWTFSAWSGDLGGSTNPETITMDGNKTVTATFTEDQYTLTINTVGSGSVTKSPDQATYTYGTIVDVNAIADAGWTFLAWSGDLGGSTNPETITMDGNKTVTATFTEDQYTLTINTVGSGSVTKSPDQATYTYGTIVDVNAIADAGWTFSEWSGDLTGSTNPDSITMDGNKTVTATFTEDQYTLTINTVGSGSVTKSPDQATYTYGTIVDVNAIADAGWTFLAWSGDLGGSTNPETITMDGNKTVTATFTEDQYTLTINTVGSGSVTKSPDQATYTYGSIVDVNAIADAGWTFSEWSGDLGGSTNPETITMDGNKTVTATFTEDQYTLTINTVGSGSVTKSPDQATYTYGTIVDVNAIADAGWTFSAWSGDLGGSTNPETITMDGNKTITATFTQDQYTLTINTVGNGSVTKSPDQATYTYGTIVDVNAIADAGWTFSAWSGDLGGSTNPETITMDGNKTVTATFTEDQYTLTINTVGSGSVTKSPDQATYTYGTIVDVNAIADAGWTFSAWSGDLGGSTNPETITMDGNKTITATFTQDQYTLTINTVGNGSVTKSPDQATYTYGSIVDVNAIADAGWTFSVWSGDLGGSTNPETITMDGNKTVTATFTEDQYTLTINTVGSGSVTKSPDQATYTYGSIVDVNAIADAGWTFSEWSGDLGGSTNPETITMDGNKTVTATFTEDQYTLTINTVGSGSVTKSPDQATYTYGTIVDVNAIADAGWTFSAWSGDLGGSTNPETITMDGNRTITATFTEDQYTLTINTVGNGSVTRSPDQATYTYGSIVDVNAIADAGWTFANWSGDLGGSTNPETITMDGNKTITATFTEDQYTLTINTVGNGSVTKSPDQATYTYGTIVDVNAIADAGWTFSVWSGDLGGSTNPETITMNGNRTITATFTEDQYTLTINTVGNGSVTRSPDQATYTYGSIVDVNAIADAGWTFANWSGDLGGSTNPETITMNGNRTITATFTEDQYTLTINTVGNGSVTKSPDQATYTYGSIVDVNAIADAGWTFANWSGDLGGSTNPETITMDGNKTVTATFTEDQYTLTINTVGSGSVTKSPDQATYTYGSIVDVNAIADAGWTFSAWSGDLGGSTNPETITMDGNRTITATFTEDQYTLTINTVGNGSVTKSPDQATYTYGSIVDVNAIADAGWTFSAWSGDLGGSTNPETITMDGNKTVTATFTEALLSDNFDDNRRSAMWRSFANNYDNAWVVENTNRLNVRATGNVNNLIAFYVANGWSFDVNESFAIEVDFHYSGISDQNGWAGITVENNDGYVSISAGSDGYESYFYYEGIVDGNMVSEQELRGSNDGTLYISYDADSNNLYLSHVGYGSGNAYIWQTISNPLQVQWTSPVDVAVGGGSDEVVLGLGEAYLDNFEIATATLLGWPPATDLDSDGFIGWGDVAIMRGHWLDTIVHPDLVGHWKMNDNATNTTVVDSSGNGNDGTAQQNTSVLHTNGKINGALTFDGTTDYVDCGDIDIGTGPRTFAAWVRADSTSGVTTIIGKDTGGATTEAGWLYQSSSNILWKLRNPAGSSIRMFTTTLTTGGWHFLVATYDTTDMHVYFDGVLDDGPLLGAVPDSVPDNSIPLQIGARGNGAYKFNGTIDNVMIFNKALTPEEIAALYNAGNGTETGPGDINNDGIVNFLDFAELGLAW